MTHEPTSNRPSSPRVRSTKAASQSSIGGLMRIRLGQRMVEAPPDGGVIEKEDWSVGPVPG